MATREEIAWAAGLFEGEGSIVLLKQTSVRLSLEMTDRDVIGRFQEVVGCGRITDKTRTQSLPQWKPRFHWYLNARDDVERVLRMLYPWLHSRRSAKADEAFELLAINPGRNIDKTHCRNGHDLTPENVYLYFDPTHTKLWRRCKACHRRRANERYARLKVAD